MQGQELTKARSTFLPERPSTSTNGRAVAVLLKPLIDLHGEPKNWRTAAPLYIEALADIPPELLDRAVKYAVASNPYFPKPADLRASIIEELANYRRTRELERQLALPVPEEPPAPTAEDRAYVDAAVARAVAALGGTTRRSAPRAEWKPSEEQLKAGLAELQSRGDVPRGACE